MAEYIERKALKEHIKSYTGMFTDEIGFAVSLEAVLRGIDFQHAADVVEVVHGRWEPRMQDDGYGEYLLYFCSECGAVSPNMTRNYCQHCGARMDGE